MDDHYRQPAVNVKTRGLLLPQHDEAYTALTEQELESLYQGRLEFFWSDAACIAEDYGYGRVYASGRMGGWLIVEIPAAFGQWWDELDDDEHDARHPLSGGSRSRDNLRHELSSEPDETGLEDWELADLQAARAGRAEWRKFAAAIQSLQATHERGFVDDVREAVADAKTTEHNNRLACAGWRY